eukprot:TRINITY_DN7759_c0_g1_i1.p1 TRINITY_DN7759_c0_g1~~TRINITY_DN7759_c0_g1_i1.p1  ORF type:complete len:181 (+),score=64.76 TRINITY_DN7759_c0_g1_i1:10-552(+)
MIRRPPRSTPKPSSAASDVYKRQESCIHTFPTKRYKVAEGICASCKKGKFTIFDCKECEASFCEKCISRKETLKGYCICGTQLTYSTGEFICITCSSKCDKTKNFYCAVCDFGSCGCNVEKHCEHKPQIYENKKCSLCYVDRSNYFCCVACQFIICSHCCLLYTSPSPRDQRGSRMPSSA